MSIIPLKPLSGYINGHSTNRGIHAIWLHYEQATGNPPLQGRCIEAGWNEASIVRPSWGGWSSSPCSSKTAGLGDLEAETVGQTAVHCLAGTTDQLAGVKQGGRWFHGFGPASRER